jgi:hypothetical protein
MGAAACSRPKWKEKKKKKKPCEKIGKDTATPHSITNGAEVSYQHPAFATIL